MNNGQYIIAMMRDIIGQQEGLAEQELKRMHFLLDMMETLVDFGGDLWAEGLLEMEIEADAQSEKRLETILKPHSGCRDGIG